jgi:long-chain acyl-CoA synthetase
MLSHNNIVSNVLAVEHLPPVDHRDTALSFLPLCHSYERVLTYLYQYLGVSVYYAESMEKIGDNIREIHPQVFSAVPRLLEKVFDRIVDKGKELTGVKRSLFFWALDLGLRFELDGRNGWWYDLQLSIARRLIFSKWREALGGNTRVIVSGGAALQPRLARVFWAAGIPVLEGYGLTETSPIIAVNNFEPRGTCFSTVGPVIKDVEVRIAPDGEILCKGPNVMLGYYNRPDLTAEVIDADGWFHTGDIGMFVEDRFLKITDRKKEIFKTSGGKYIAPQVLENRLKESPFIEQVMVVGENRKFPGALIVPSFAHLRRWCEEAGIPYSSDAEMARKPEAVARIAAEVEEINRTFSQFEQIKKFELVGKEWTVDGGELTATLKLRRKILMERHQQLVERIYEEEGASVSIKS